MHLPQSLPLHLLLLLDASLVLARHEGVHNTNFLLRAAHKARRHSKGLVDDLRVALGTVLDRSSSLGPGVSLSRRDQASSGDRKNILFCKSNNLNADHTATGGGGAGGNGTMTSSGTGGGQRGTHSSSATTSLQQTTDRTTSSSTAPTSSSNGSGVGQPTTTTTTKLPDPTPDSPFRLVSSHAGNDFFQGWDFWTFGDPTSGIVDYVDEATARSNGLLEVNSAGNAIMRLETTPQVSGNRKAIRITTQLALDRALWILDAVHVPTGCGTWPAFWTNGPNWPAGGEFDILEGVHDATANQVTLHTNSGCSLSSSSSNTYTGRQITPATCDVSGGVSNTGCGILATQSNTYGSAFNSIGGGVYAGLLDSDGAAVWFFPRGSIPGDIEANAPQPANWGTPQARFTSDTCDMEKLFYQQVAIFTNTLCGQWAGNVWNAAGGPGQEQSCAQRTGVATCEEYVRKNGGSFTQAYWEVKSVKIYQRK